ncbi:tetratricopeptide repeat protein [Sphingomonas adhaesiva]|uniref:tetratricopeptide repeat protein n=1 Tax=Sphingomonas adhaesiva TaxID=28212 RepID=UPI002FF4F92F
MNDPAPLRLRRLLGYLDADPDNPPLLADAIRAALDAGEVDRADALAAHLRLVTPGSAESGYLTGMVAMHRGDFAAATQRFRDLLALREDAATRFNLAWSLAMTGDKATALATLTPPVVDAVPAAAMLRVQLLHEAQRFDEAMAIGRAALARFPDDHGLLAAMATLALDVDDADLARACAVGAGDHPEALAALGVLDLHAGDLAAAQAAFDRSLAAREVNPRAWIGRGLAELAGHRPAAAAPHLDRGAQQFGDHIGSWIAAGWAWYLAGDAAAGRQRFERALAIDPAFAESHGSLAVTDIAEGRRDDARRRMTTALRLDRQCFSAALAGTLLASDDPAAAAVIVERAMATPIDGGQMTIAGYLARLTQPTLH